MTDHASTRSTVAWSLAITLAGLAGVALLDKLLTVRLGAVAMAQWAQLQSLGELVAGIVGAGLTQGLVVLAAPAGSHALQMRWLWLSVLMGLAITAPLALVALLPAVVGAWPAGWSQAALPDVARDWLAGHLDALSDPALLVAVVMAGAWLGIGQMQLNSLWVARGHLATSFVVGVALTAASLLAGLLAPAADLPLWLSLVRLLLLALLLTLVWIGAREHVRTPDWRHWARSSRTEMARFLWMGVAIGLLTPAGQMLARASVAEAHGWEAVAAMQGLWRMGNWVGGVAAGLLALWLLPRWSRAGAPPPAARLLRDGLRVVLPAWLCLLALWWWQTPLAGLLFDARFAVAPQVAAGFLLGEAVRALAWIFLFGLMAARRTWAVVLTEFASLPLFATLTWAVPTRGLADVGLLYLLTYVVYAVSLALCLVRRPRRAGGVPPG
jgi:O-antigen/teichoic acid export membrane protein